MNKLFVIGLASIAGLALAACDPVAETKKVQGQTVAACSYLPTAETIGAIAKTLYSPSIPFVDVGSVIANKICDAVTNIPLADGPGDHKPRVNGVVVKGKFVK